METGTEDGDWGFRAGWGNDGLHSGRCDVRRQAHQSTGQRERQPTGQGGEGPGGS